MRASVGIQLLLLLCFFPVALSAQEKELVVQDVSQDDLGNVTDAFQEYFFEALKQKGVENYEKAIAALEKCLKIDPKPVVYFEMGKNYNHLERFSEAATFLEQARKLSPDNRDVLAELYTTYYGAKEFQKALPVVEELRQLDPTFSEDLANLYILNEKYDQALELLEELDTRRGHSDYRESLRRQIYARTDNTDAGINDLQKKIQEEPENEEHYLNLIFLYSENGEPDKAFQTARELLQRQPESEKVHLALYKFYLDRDNQEQGLNSMKKVLRGDLIDEETKYEVLQDFLLFVSANPSYEEDLLEVVEIFSADEGNTRVFLQLGSFFLQAGKKEKALEFFEAGVARGSSEFELLLNTLLLQVEFNRFEAARKLSQIALKDYPSQPILYLVYGTVLNQGKDYLKAEEILTFGLDFLIDDPPMEADFYQQLSLSYQGLQQPQKAEEFRRKAATTLKKNDHE